MASPRQRSLIEAITLAGTFAVTLTSWAAVTAFPDSHDSRAHIIGVTAVAILGERGPGRATCAHQHSTVTACTCNRQLDHRRPPLHR